MTSDIDLISGIAYCYGCNHYFPVQLTSKRNRDEIVIPEGTDFLRLRILRDELEIKIKWSRNFQFWKALSKKEFPGIFIAFALIFNRTVIEVKPRYIKIDHRPFDILPMAFYSSRVIKQFQVEPMGFDSASGSSYGLYVLLSSGNKVLLLWNLKKTTLLFIEQEMERVLKIADTE